MELRVLNTSFIHLDILEGIDSILWIERYNSEGQFEIYTKYSEYYLSLLQQGFYLISDESERVMIIETIIIKTDPDEGDKLLVKGRSIESLLDRRIIIDQILIDDTLQNGIHTLLDAEVINSLYPERNYGNFIFSASVDPVVTAPLLNAQYFSENLLVVIKNICKQANLGFKVIKNASNQFVFSLYAGKDRSFGQGIYPPVLFSPDFDNLTKSEYYQTKVLKKNYILVWTDPSGGLGSPLNAQAWTADVGTGLNRWETALEASDMSKIDVSTGLEIPDLEFHDMLFQRGVEELTKTVEFVMFEGEVDMSRTYAYGVDFFLGDIIQLKDNYGHSAEVRIDEITYSQNPSGSTIHPTLVTV